MSFWQDQNEFIAIIKKGQNILKTALKKKKPGTIQFPVFVFRIVSDYM
jgi:hypothetical protein